jgi:hypothetical protein
MSVTSCCRSWGMLSNTSRFIEMVKASQDRFITVWYLAISEILRALIGARGQTMPWATPLSRASYES